MVMFFLHSTIAFDGFSMVLLQPEHHHWMFFPRLTIDINGFSKVFSKFRCDGQRWFWPIKKDLKKARYHKIFHFFKMQKYNDEERRGMKGFQFTSAELKIVHDFTPGCLTFTQILLPLQRFINFLGHHHHWMEWFWPTIEINGFSMVLGSRNHR